MTRPRLVIFDCDGTLVDSETISAEVMAAFVTAQGWALDPAGVRARFLGFRLPAVQAAVEARVGHALPPGWLEDFQARRVEAFHRHGVTEIPGAGATVRTLRAAGLAVCVASNAIREKSRLTLGLSGLLPLLDPERIFSATQVPAGKPAPDLFRFAARECGAEPAACVVVEDSPTGIAAARAADMRALAYAGPGGGEAAALERAGGEVIHALGEIPGALGLTP